MRPGRLGLHEWREYMAALYSTKAERSALFAIVEGGAQAQRVVSIVMYGHVVSRADVL